MGDFIEQLLIGFVLATSAQVCFENRRLARDQMLWDLDLASQQAFTQFLKEVE